MSNNNLMQAKSAKADEFYTQLCDIEKELAYYVEHFRDKTIYCNCDNPEFSAFWEYFHRNFTKFNLKSLICTYYDSDNYSYKSIYTGGADEDISYFKSVKLVGNGDFRSDECIEILNEADIVITNPPFSLFREYSAQLMQYDKKFLVIGNINALTYKEIFPLIKSGEIWLGTGMGRWISGFIVPENYNLYGTEVHICANGEKVISTNNCMWLTNLSHSKQQEDIICYRHYTSDDSPTYDNYDGIHVNRVSDIPIDYDGVMGVPITFLGKYNPEQFEIVGFRKGIDGKDLQYTLCGKVYHPYGRVLIRRRIK